MLAERMHWTLDYIDALEHDEMRRIWAILEATDKAKAWKSRHSGGGNDSAGG